MMKLFENIHYSKSSKIILDGLWRDNPITCMMLGICSALAITNRVENAIAMGVGVTFVLISTAIVISSLRNFIPVRVRIITYMIVISSFVIIVDRSLKAFYPEISEAIGPYVGLIITNCIIMGRAEAFDIKNSVGHSVMDGISNGIGYTYALVIISAGREVLGFGTLLGIRVTPHDWTNWVVMAMAPGAFFMFSIYLWITRTLMTMRKEKRKEEHKENII